MARRRRRRRRNGRASIGFVSLTLLLSAACAGSTRPGATVAESTILVGAFDFTESEILANLYAGALRTRGYEVEVLTEVAAREIMEPALEQGRVDVVPEYQGTLLRFLEPDLAFEESNPADELKRLLEERGMVALDPAPAQNKNVIVVTHATATRLDVESLSDLEPFSADLVFGGPPECPARPLCLQGLEDTYGIEFARFQPLDAGGPLTVAALVGGEVDVALLFQTDPRIDEHNLVVLEDDRGLQPAENILPVVREEVAARHGDSFADALNDVSEKLTTDRLRALNAAVIDAGRTAEEVADEWLEANGVS